MRSTRLSAAPPFLWSIPFAGAFQAAVDPSSTWWQYLLLLLAVTASWAGVPVIGTAAAGAAGVAASQGRLDLAAVLVITAVAGEIGGLIGYRIGFRWGRKLAQRPGKHQGYRQEVLAKGEQACEKWGRFAVFVTPAVVSGTGKMPHRQFVIWNLVDAVGFALFTVAGAYGISRLLTGHHAIKDLAILVLGVGAGTLLLILARRHRRNSVAQRKGP
jgi:membrane protein DedA with SNARE-associated domain